MRGVRTRHDRMAYGRHRMLSVSHLLAVLLLMAFFPGCDVHEFPETPEMVPVVLHLEYETELPVYKEITVGTKSREQYRGGTKAQEKDLDLRYIVKVYGAGQGEDNREEYASMVFTKPAGGALDTDVRMSLPVGEWRFLVWTDYVKKGSAEDTYYNTGDYREIIIKDRNPFIGSSGWKDAFRGDRTAEVKRIRKRNGTLDASRALEGAVEDRITVKMARPLAKYTFIATDYDRFRTAVLAMLAKIEAERKAQDEAARATGTGASTDDDTKSGGGTKVFNPDDYKVVIRYSGFFPCSYNMFTGKPADAWTEIRFDSDLLAIDSNEASLGFDYVFINGSETSVDVVIEVYDNEENLLSATNPVTVPLTRGKHTIVRGEFLTSMASGGVGIDPGFDGEFNLKINCLDDTMN